MAWAVFDILCGNFYSKIHIWRDSWNNWRRREHRQPWPEYLVSVQNSQAGRAESKAGLVANTRREPKMRRPSLSLPVWGRASSNCRMIWTKLMLSWLKLDTSFHLWIWKIHGKFSYCVCKRNNFMHAQNEKVQVSAIGTVAIPSWY